MSSISPSPPRPTSSSASALKNVTIDDGDSSLKYSQGWKRSTSSAAFGGSFQESNNVGDLVSFSLPDNAIAVYCFGFKQSSGALYEACLDCNIKDSSNIDVIDGHTNDTKSKSEPTLLYQKTNLDPTVRHSLALLNVPDSRFGNKSTITVDSFVVTVKDGGTSSSASSSASSMSAMSLMAMNTGSVTSDSSSSTTQAAAGPPDPPSSTITSAPSSSSSSSVHTQDQSALSSGQRAAQKLRSPLLLTGVILATLFVVFTALFALMYFMRRRKRRKTAPGRMYEGTHWAARFFGDKGRGSVWAGRMADTSAGTGGNGAGSDGFKVVGEGVGGEGKQVKVAKGAMIEQLVPDRDPARRPTTYASLPSRPNPTPKLKSKPSPPPVSQLVYRDRYGPGNASEGRIAEGRTVPRSAFPISAPSQTGPHYMQNQQLGRAQSLIPRPNQSPGPPANFYYPYSVIPFPAADPSPVPGPGPGSLRNPSTNMTTPRQNPYVEEARARVQDRARGVVNRPNGWRPMPGKVITNDPGYYGPAAARSADGSAAWYERPELRSPVYGLGPSPITDYGRSGPGPQYGQYGSHDGGSPLRNGSLGSQYSQ